MRRDKGCAFGAWVLVAAGVAVGLAVSWALALWGPCACLAPTCAPCLESEDLAHCRGGLARAQQHLLEAQQDYRRCLLSHTPRVAAAVRGGSSSSSTAAGVDGAEAARRAALLQELGGAQLVPRPAAPVDVVVLWINGSDPAWQYARNAVGGAARSLHSDNGELRALLRSLAKYGGELGIGAVHLVAPFEQRPAWLGRPEVPGSPAVRLVGGDAGPGLDDLGALLRQVPELPGLAEDFLLWSPLAALGKPAHRSDFWLAEGGWGPRFFPTAPLRPVPVSRRALQLYLARHSGGSAGGYAQWLSSHGLAGAVEAAAQGDAVALEVAQCGLQEALRLSRLHTFVCFPNERGLRLPPLQALLEQRWSDKTPHEM